MESKNKLLSRIEILSKNVTQQSYNEYIKKGFQILVDLKNLKAEEKEVYDYLLNYRNTLEDKDLSVDYIEHLMDYVCGWCNREYYIWRNLSN